MLNSTSKKMKTTMFLTDERMSDSSRTSSRVACAAAALHVETLDAFRSSCRGVN